MNALKLVQENLAFREMFTELGDLWIVSDELFNHMQEFTCQLYFRNTKIVKVNELRYKMFCAKKGDIESFQLPPCEDTLLQHTLRTNYQAAIWKLSLERQPDIRHVVGYYTTTKPSEGHGWELNTK